MERRQFCRNLVSLAVLGALTHVLSACQPTTERTHLVEYEKNDHSFPVIIHHALGSSKITKQPKRIICLGAGSEDIVFALGQMPIAIESHIWGGDAKGYLPWFKEAVLNQGEVLPEVIHMYPELDIAKIIRLAPDIIVAPQSGITPEIYRQLSRKIPIIAYPNRPWLTPVHQQIEMIGAALGLAKEAEALKARMAENMRHYREQYPQLSQYTFAYLNAGSRMAYLSAYVAGDPRVDSLIELGLKPAPFMKDLHVKQGAFAATIGLENVDLLKDVDVVISWFNSEAVKESVDQIPLYRAIPAIQNGAYVPLTDQSLVMAMSYGSPLSLPWGIKRFVPRLLSALANVPKPQTKDLLG